MASAVTSRRFRLSNYICRTTLEALTKTRIGQDRIGSERVDKIRTGSVRVNKTWIGLRPIDKTRTGSEKKNRIEMNSRQNSHVTSHNQILA